MSEDGENLSSLNSSFSDAIHLYPVFNLEKVGKTQNLFMCVISCKVHKLIRYEFT